MSHFAPAAPRGKPDAGKWFARAAKAAKYLAFCALILLFVAAIFAVPHDYKLALKGHAAYVRTVATDEKTRADAMKYVHARLALMPAIVADIRRAACAHANATLWHAFACLR